MDNLIRIRKGLPILQLDYIHMTGTVTDTGSAAVGGSQTFATDQYFNIPSTALALSRMLTNVYTYGASGMKVNQLTVTAEPVTNAPEVYNAYLAFLKEPEHLMETYEPPTSDEALIVRCAEQGCGDPACAHKKHRHKVYYWVPCAYKDEFFRLALYTVALRGQPTPVSPNFDVTVMGVLDKVKGPRNVWTIKVQLDKKIPNDKGYMIATVGGNRYTTDEFFTVLRNEKVPRAQPGDLKEEQMNDVFDVKFDLDTLKITKVDDVIKDLAGQKVGIRLEHFVPGGTPTDRLLEGIRSQLELFRLGQFQPTTR
jgi:hypothetical protein